MFAVAFCLATPALAVETLDYGSRAGMEVDVVSKTDLDTDHAAIHVKHTRANAITFCRDYAGHVTPKCIREELADPLAETVTANCTTGRFTTFSGDTYKFAGPSKADIVMAKYRIIDMSTGEVFDGSMASGYPTAIHIFRALCPHHAPVDE